MTVQQMERRYAELMREVRFLAPQHDSVSIGAGFFDSLLEAEMLRGMLDGHRRKLTSADCAAVARSYLERAVYGHNAKRPNDHNWLRDPKAGQWMIGDIVGIVEAWPK